MTNDRVYIVGRNTLMVFVAALDARFSQEVFAHIAKNLIKIGTIKVHMDLFCNYFETEAQVIGGVKFNDHETTRILLESLTNWDDVIDPISSVKMIGTPNNIWSVRFKESGEYEILWKE